MAVALTYSNSFQGVAVNDVLEGGGNGLDLGNVTNSSYAPLIDKSLNQGKRDLYIRHDGTSKITSVGFFIQTFGTGTGFTYGGAQSAASDNTLMRSLGNSSGSSKNNADGLSGGLWMDMDRDSNDTTRFDFANNGAGQGGNDTVIIFGDNNTDGIDLASAYTLKAQAMAKDAGGSVEADADTPVDGEIGPSGDATLGEEAHANLRIYVPTSQPDGGVVQWELVTKYSFTD